MKFTRSICLSLFLVFAAGALHSKATTLVYPQCVGSDPACIAPIESQNGFDPGTLLAADEAQIHDYDNGGDLFVGVIHSAVFRNDAGTVRILLSVGSQQSISCRSAAV